MACEVRPRRQTPVSHWNRFASGVAVMAALIAPKPVAAQTPRTQLTAGDDWTVVENALGRRGTMQPGGVMRFSFPRRDLHVAVGSVQVRPALALGSWVAFKRVGGARALVMGDLVLTEDEVDAVISALQAGGVEETALHNHVLRESPRTMYLHVAGHGD